MLQKNEDNLNNKNHCGVFMLFLLKMQIASLMQDKVSFLFLRLESLIELFVFRNQFGLISET